MKVGQEGLATEGARIVAEIKYPIVIFSHGAFGTRSSNTSAYMENKQNLMKEFIDQLSFYLGICENMKMTSKDGLI